MVLWLLWWSNILSLRKAFSRSRTFLWFSLCIAGITVRKDLAGVTSTVRSLGLKSAYYDRMPDCFHSPAIRLEVLIKLWTKLILKVCAGFLLTVNGKYVILGDGIKIPKSGKKMPAVKKLHQESDSNTKPKYIFGHSCQAVAIVAGFMKTFFAIPLASRIHEGVVFSNRDKRTLLDKMMELVGQLQLIYRFILAPCRNNGTFCFSGAPAPRTIDSYDNRYKSSTTQCDFALWDPL